MVIQASRPLEVLSAVVMRLAAKFVVDGAFESLPA